MRGLSRFWVIPLLLPFALVWQLSPLAVLPVFGWRVDPALALVIVGGLLFGPAYGVAFGLVAGACQDLLLGAGLLYGVTKAIAGLFAGLIQPHIYRLDALSLVLVGLTGTLGEGLMIAMYLLSQGRTGVWDHFAALALPLGLAHAFMLVALYYVLIQLPAPEARE